ncbi:MAG: ferrous iron transport protein B [Pseudomonadales bacterium]
MTCIALVGNPNCGKTTLFNALTGARQRVGNWPGVTVERKTGSFAHGGGAVEVVDLPGTYSLSDPGSAIDERITRDYLLGGATDVPHADVVVNVVDASSLARGLALTTELLEAQRPVVVALNMMDVADRHGLHIDAFQLATELGCPVVPIIATRGEGLGPLKDAVESVQHRVPPRTLPAFASLDQRFHYIDAMLARCVRETPIRRTVTDRVDALVLNRYLAFPLFLGAMYLMFLFAINVGSAFIDFFDLLGSVLFVEGPRQLLEGLGLPGWLTALLCDGVGGGVQLVGTFIPVIGCLFLALSFLEDSGYMARVAFIVDRLLRRLGLPGKSFVPLIVGFGCNVPAVMATRTLDNQPDRILTTIMAPYMSCGARLTVYVLFATAFFPHNGQNVVFALYLIGIVIAVLSALAVRRYLLKAPAGSFLLELPAYHLPTVKGLLLQTWQRLKGFVLRAGKAIVAVVVVLNTVNSVGVDGSFGNQNTEQSVLSVIGKQITPIFGPMGISEDNWPATVGIFTGVFAKEVVVGTLDALYAADQPPSQATLSETVVAAFESVPANLAALAGQLTDPLGLAISEVEDVGRAAADQGVSLGTIGAMQNLFAGQLGAFAYLLFVLLYMPCVATVGVIVKELGGFWATFSVVWSASVAYACAVLTFQLGRFSADPAGATLWSLLAVGLAATVLTALIRFGRRREQRLIPLVSLD